VLKSSFLQAVPIPGTLGQRSATFLKPRAGLPVWNTLPK